MSPKKVSIVVLTWNKLNYTKKCFNFLKRNTKYANWEVIVVDNGSTDGTIDYLKEKKRSEGEKYKIILNSKNLGYAGGVNQGIKAAHGDYILLLNNDVYVWENWLTNMVDTIEGEEEISVVGARLIYPQNNRIQHAGIAFIRKIEPLHIYKNSSINNPNVNEVRSVDAVTGACMLIKREIIDEIGFFDERFKFGGFEDTDFCLRSRIKGYKIIYLPTSVAFHDERISSSQIHNYYIVFKKNYKLFMKKWGRILDKYNDEALSISFKLKMYLIYGIFKLIPKRLEFSVKKWLSSIFQVQ